jgi:cytochrome P450
MAPSVYLGLLVLVCYLLHRIIDFVRQEKAFQSFARSHDCSVIYNDDGPLPWGLSRVYKILTARKRNEDILDDILLPPIKSHHTLEHTVLGGNKIIETAEPQNHKTVYVSKFKDYQVSENRLKAFGSVTGINTMTTNGPAWEHSRGMLKPQFSKSSINNLEGVERELEIFWAAIEQGGVSADHWTTELDLAPLVYRLVTDAASHFLFGESIGSQKTYLEEASLGHASKTSSHAKSVGSDEFTRAYEYCTNVITLRMRLQLPGFLFNTKEFKKQRGILRSLPDKYVEKALAGNHVREDVKYDLLSALVDQTHDATELKDQVLSIFNAGRDVTGTLLLWTMILLGQNPRVFHKLRSIILEAFPQDDPSIRNAGKLRGCQYLQHVLQESLRVCTPVPINTRQALKDTVLPVGGGPDGSEPIAVRKGQLVMMHTHVMHNRKDIWGDDALEFKPERWADWATLSQKGAMFAPFSAGPRNCIGRKSLLPLESHIRIYLYIFCRGVQHGRSQLRDSPVDSAIR